MLAGNYAKLDNETLNWLSIGYLGSRVAYNLLYVNNTSDGTGEFGDFDGVGMILTDYSECQNWCFFERDWNHFYSLC